MHAQKGDKMHKNTSFSDLTLNEMFLTTLETFVESIECFRVLIGWAGDEVNSRLA